MQTRAFFARVSYSVASRHNYISLIVFYCLNGGETPPNDCHERNTLAAAGTLDVGLLFWAQLGVASRYVLFYKSSGLISLLFFSVRHDAG